MSRWSDARRSRFSARTAFIRETKIATRPRSDSVHLFIKINQLSAPGPPEGAMLDESRLHQPRTMHDVGWRERGALHRQSVLFAGAAAAARETRPWGVTHEPERIERLCAAADATPACRLASGPPGGAEIGHEATPQLTAGPHPRAQSEPSDRPPTKSLVTAAAKSRPVRNRD